MTTMSRHLASLATLEERECLLPNDSKNALISSLIIQNESCAYLRTNCCCQGYSANASCGGGWREEGVLHRVPLPPEVRDEYFLSKCSTHSLRKNFKGCSENILCFLLFLQRKQK
jgi:hypothetical protein